MIKIICFMPTILFLVTFKPTTFIGNKLHWSFDYIHILVIVFYSDYQTFWLALEFPQQPL